MKKEKAEWKYILDMWYSELTNTIYALVRDRKWNIVEKKDVTDRVLRAANKIYIDRLNESIEKGADKD